jgi:hypothetical protein
MAACRQLTAAGVQSHAAGIMVALPSGINAGWLRAATYSLYLLYWYKSANTDAEGGGRCIGVVLVLQCAVRRPLPLNATGVCVGGECVCGGGVCVCVAVAVAVVVVWLWCVCVCARARS